MPPTLPPTSPSRRRFALGLLAVPAIVLAGCSSDEPVDPVSPMAGAVTACLSAAQENFGFPADQASALDVSVQVDDQGWWAVSAVAQQDGAARNLTCTAVPDSGPLGATAASFSVSGG